MKSAKNHLFITILAVITISGGALFAYKNNVLDFFQEPLPIAQPYQPTVQPSSKPKPSQLPMEINLDVPFTSQAPFQNWDLPYGEFCEEASVLMTASYINKWSIPNPDTANQKMLAIKEFEENRFGYYQDTTAEETATILKEFYKIEKVKLVYEPTVEAIKKYLAEGKVVIVPVAGRELGNPHFKQPGPLYHMLIIKGYTKSGDFITNDPGTRVGANYIYKPSVIMNAIHNWNKENISQGRKVVIIVG